ncbi:semaphorin-4E-like [Anableps anableps]
MMSCRVVLLYVLIIMSEGPAHSHKPRRSIFFSDVKVKLFSEPDFDGLSSLMVRDDIGQLFIGARGKVIVLSLDDITKKTGETQWTVSSSEKALCEMKGKSSEDCENYIRVLHTLDDGSILVCGTNAFNPACTHLMFKGGNITMETTFEDGKGKVPFDPNVGFASLMKDPNMISMNIAELYRLSENKEDDNVFLFFTEKAVEERSHVRLSRIARVCKSDLGGLRTLQKKWTSFLKARLECPFGDRGSPPLVKDVFFLQDEDNVMESIFYATFTTNPKPSSTCSQSAICAYKLSDIRKVFMGNFLTESNSGSWVGNKEAVPFPYPGSCINNEMRANGMKSSRRVADKTLLFVRDHPLMEGVVRPITGRPLLVQSAAQFSRIVVDKVTSLDGQQHNIIFIGNSSGWLQKGVWSDDDGVRIIEELQLFQDSQPILFLQLSSKSGQLYSGARTAAVQLSVRDCSRYASCDDCLIARDPYCGWDLLRGLCDAVVGASTSMIQNLTDGDVGSCPSSDSSKQLTTVHLTLDVAQFLPCSPDTNLPVSWSFSDNLLQPGPQHILLSQGLIVTPSINDTGLYTCETVEEVRGREHRKAVIRYLVKVYHLDRRNKIQERAISSLAALCVLALMILFRCWRQRTQNRAGCCDNASDAGLEGSIGTGVEERP